MSLDIDIIKARAKNEYRLSKVRGEAMISVRIPGGIMPAHLLAVAQQIAEQYGNGLIHLTTRQKLAMPGIKYQDMDKVNAALEPFIKEIEVETCGIEVEDTTAGYQTIGGRNIVACQGNTICQKGNIDCTGLAQRMEKHLYPNPYHLKMVIAGCPNDCAKANMADFGILGIVIVAVISYATLRLSERITQVIGANGMNALSKVMGFLILCIGIQFVVNGVLGIITDPAVLRAVRDAFGSA